MENGIGLYNFIFDKLKADGIDIEKQDICSYSPLTLAYIGDGVYELVVRSMIVTEANAPVNKLHKRSSELVKAETARVLKIASEIEETVKILAEVMLSPEAASIFKETGDIYADGIKTRGRNIFLNVKEAMESGIGQYGQETGTALWALNGLTTCFQNEANFSDEEIKFDSLMGGNAYNKIQKAQELLLAAA